MVAGKDNNYQRFKTILSRDAANKRPESWLNLYGDRFSSTFGGENTVHEHDDVGVRHIPGSGCRFQASLSGRGLMPDVPGAEAPGYSR